MPRKSIRGNNRFSFLSSLLGNFPGYTYDGPRAIPVEIPTYEATTNYTPAPLAPAPNLDLSSVYWQPNVPVEEQPVSTTKVAAPKKSYSNKREFVQQMHGSYYRTLRNRGMNDEDSNRIATYLTQKNALETGYGEHFVGRHNYGNHRTKKGWANFNSMDEFAEADVKLLDRKWPSYRKARSIGEFVDAINTNNGYGKYAPPEENPNYKGRVSGTSKTVQGYLKPVDNSSPRRKLKCGGAVARPKAFLGALIGSVIGAGASIFSSSMQANAQKEALEEQRRKEREQKYNDLAIQINNQLNSRDAEQAYRSLFRTAYSEGGGIRNHRFSLRGSNDNINIESRGAYLTSDPNGITKTLHGRKHSNGGINLSVNGVPINAEKDEKIVQLSDGAYILSDAININTPSGKMTPAEGVDAGYSPYYMIALQQKKNNNRGISLAGTARCGGKLSSPVGRIRADIGTYVPNWLTRFLVGNNNPSRTETVTLEDGRTFTIPVGGYTGAPNILPGRVGGFRPTDIKQAYQASRQLLSRVQQGIKRAVPTNTVKVTNGPRVLNSTKGELLNSQRATARGYDWLRRTPMEQGYSGYTIGRGVASEAYPGVEGSLTFGSVGDYLASGAWKRPVGIGLGIAGGLGAVGGLTYAASTEDNNDTKEFTKEKELVNNTSGYVPNGQQVVDFSNKAKVNKPVSTQTPTYVTGAPTGSNPAPYKRRQLPTLAAPTLDIVDVQIPNLDNYFNNNGTTRRSVATGGNKTVVSPKTAVTPKSVVNTELTDVGPVVVPRSRGIIDRRIQPIAGSTYNERSTNPYATYTPITKVNSNGSSINSTDTNNSITGVRTRGGLQSGMRFNWGDLIGAGIGAAGSLISGLIDYNAAKNIEDPITPTPVMAIKMPTHYSIGAELGEIGRARQRLSDDARDNTSSSSALLSRRNLINTTMNDAINQQWGIKTNKENEMLTRDALNQQQVAMQNVSNYNNYLDRLSEIRNRRSLAKSSAISGMIGDLADIGINTISNAQQRYQDEQAMNAIISASERGSLERMHMNGVDISPQQIQNRINALTIQYNNAKSQREKATYKAALDYWNSVV